ncbi:DUF1611 domain-containing protein [Demequina muriae]|uniref:DUF1611 domain-containing protein n=1 Tax=Demequina muriae TaxID=3051664 RepID=A0ABT8GGU3_9MICO|nr:DUF1611 domain-containing protein [Demequina sp. EGI L300058]MDN4480658.1 DUF1611 domain-containing protein [Demequina sp. EGI L300058]
MRPVPPPVSALPAPTSADSRPTAVVYCEGNFARIDGKTANGLVRSSERYRIVAVIDSTIDGADAGLALGDVAAGIPVVDSLAAALAVATPGPLDSLESLAAPVPSPMPDVFIFGLAPLSGLMSPADRAAVIEAIGAGLDIVSGLHEFLEDDPEISAHARKAGVTLHDIRRPRPTRDLRMFDGAIDGVDCLRIAILGTDGAIGKRTTATLLTSALKAAGVHAVMVGTGQTGLMQGAKYGVALDAIPAQFGVGELEGAVVSAWEGERPQVIVVEGQGALSHPAYLSSTVVLRASRPQAVILQHAPGRTVLSDYPDVAMPQAADELALIELFGRTRVIGLAINHENMQHSEVAAAAALYEFELGIPAADPLWDGADRLADMVLQAYPALVPEGEKVAT